MDRCIWLRRLAPFAAVATSIGWVGLATAATTQGDPSWGGAQPAIRAPSTAEDDRLHEIVRSLCQNTGSARLMREAETIIARTYGDHHPANAQYLACAGHWIGTRFDFPGALRSLEHARAIYASLPAAQQDGFDDLLNDIGGLYMLQGRYDDAFGVTAYRRARFPETPRTAGDAFAIGNLLYDKSELLTFMGRLQDAEADARQRLALVTPFISRDTDLVPAERALANVLIMEGRHSDAVDFAALALNTQRAAVADGQLIDFDDYIATTATLARALQGADRADEGERRLRQLEEERIRWDANGIGVTGGAEPEIAKQLFFFYLAGRQFPQAVAAAQQYLALISRGGDGNTPQPEVLVTARGMLGLAQCGTGDIASARANLAEAERSLGQVRPLMNTPLIAPWWAFTAECELRAGNRAEATERARRSLAANRSLMNGAAARSRDTAGALLPQVVPAALTLLRAQWTPDRAALSDEQFRAMQQIHASTTEVAALEAAAVSRARAGGRGGLVDEYRAAETALRDADLALAGALAMAQQLRRQSDAALVQLMQHQPSRSLSQIAPAQRADYDAALAQTTEAEADLERARAERMQAAARFEQVSGRVEPQLGDYLSIRRGGTLPLDSATALLRPSEAMILLVPGSKDLPASERRGFVAIVTRDRPPVWAEIPVDANDLASSIQAIRADIEAGGRTRPGDARPSADGPRGFDRAGAHSLYLKLFGSRAIAEALSSHEDWVIVPQGEFLPVPFAALVTEAPAGGVAGDSDPNALRNTHWLGAEKNLSILPSVAVLSALRASHAAALSPDTPHLFAVGSPAMSRWQNALAHDGVMTAVVPRERQSQIRSLPELADTEISDLRQRFTVSDSDVLVGPAATEAALRSASGRLSRADIVLFATHGLVGSATAGGIDPALVLTPPDTLPATLTYSEAYRNDGLLTATEAADLRLSASWVVLSACDTAWGRGGESLTGLARAFFSAGARSLLVSQWQVAGPAAQRIVGGTITRSMRTGQPRAVALREEMRALRADTSGDFSGNSYAHPARWAAFEFVGAD